MIRIGRCSVEYPGIKILDALKAYNVINFQYLQPGHAATQQEKKATITEVHSQQVAVSSKLDKLKKLMEEWAVQREYDHIQEEEEKAEEKQEKVEERRMVCEEHCKDDDECCEKKHREQEHEREHE